MLDDTRRALVARLSRFDSVVELGIGRRTSVAQGLAARGLDVTATDIRERSVPRGVSFACDDVTAPDHELYADADALYALNWPPELHRPAVELADSVGTALLFTTLGGDQPVVPVRRVTVPGETLYIARGGSRIAGPSP